MLLYTHIIFEIFLKRFWAIILTLKSKFNEGRIAMKIFSQQNVLTLCNFDEIKEEKKIHCYKSISTKKKRKI